MSGESRGSRKEGKLYALGSVRDHVCIHGLGSEAEKDEAAEASLHYALGSKKQVTVLLHFCRNPNLHYGDH